MVKWMKGDIFKSSCQALVNPVNCVGVMGKGMALEFKKRFINSYINYRKRCRLGKMVPGKPYLCQAEVFCDIILFPTKDHWREPSRLEWIEQGLMSIATNYGLMGLKSIAMPAIGCGNGGLKFEEVRVLIEKYLGNIDLEVEVYIAK